MRRIAVINQKGGVGKTTTTASLAAAVARTGSRVLLVDLDPQGHLSLHFGVELSGDQPSVYDMLTASMPLQQVALEICDNLTLLPADIDLAGAEAELVTVTGREVLLREALEAVENDYDYMLIDGPPSLGVLTVNALVAANEVMIPLQAHFLALQGLIRLLDTVMLVRQRINPDRAVRGCWGQNHAVCVSCRLIRPAAIRWLHRQLCGYPPWRARVGVVRNAQSTHRFDPLHA